MKKVIYFLAIIAVIIGIYEETKPTPNKYIMLGCIVFLFLGAYQLMKKISSKNQDDEETI